VCISHVLAVAKGFVSGRHWLFSSFVICVEQDSIPLGSVFYRMETFFLGQFLVFIGTGSSS